MKHVIGRSDQYSRKNFLKTAGSTTLFAALGIGLFGCSSPTGSANGIDNQPSPGPDPNSDAITISNDGNTITIDLSRDDVSELGEEGGWVLLREAGALVVNVDGNKIRAFTSVCTHAACSTNWQFSNSLFQCNCHGSRFDTAGSVVRGPATRDLEEFSVERNEDVVTINK